MKNKPGRVVYCEDALLWLESRQVLEGCSLVTSLPDISEFPQWTLAEWKHWFTRTALLVLSRCPREGVTLFYQSDIKVEGTWIDKGFLCQKAAETLGHQLIWHKIICSAPPGTITYGRPSYSHLLCFSQDLRFPAEKSTADVLPNKGDKTWSRGMGLEACLLAARFISEQTSTKTVVNPFCGQGSVLAAANAFGLDAVGIERSPKRAKKAGLLALAKDRRSWELGEPFAPE